MKRTLWMLGTLLALALPVQAQTVRYVHTDALGSPVAMTNASRVEVERSEYEPYGKLLNRANDDRPGYTGHVMDAATGLTYMQQRYYDPGIGRFLSVDPVVADANTGAQFNRYAYANNNPYKFTDPDGRNPVAGAAIGCAVTGPACPAGAAVGAAVGTAVVVIGLVIIAYNEIVNDSAEPEPSDSGDRPTGDDIKFDDKIKGQLGDRGWTEEGVREVTTTEPAGTSTDNTGGRNDPATVYGTKDGGHVVVNDKTGNVTQVSDKNDPDWKPDRRIDWEEK